MGGFLGMRGTGDWVTNERPQNWREQILYLYPNGMAPLTAILSMMASEVTTDPTFNWWTQSQTSVQCAVTGVFTTADCSVAYVNGGKAGNTLFLLITDLDSANRIRAGHQILLRDSTDWRVDVNGKVVSNNIGSVSAIIGVKLLEDDDNSVSHDLSDCDTLKIIGNINPEGGEMPDAVALNPTQVFNKTQIFRTPLSLTRTARKTKLRTGDQYQRAKSEALEMHSWEMELAFLFGIMTENIGSNGKPERTSMGVINFIRQYMPSNCDDFTLNTTYTGKKWLDTGGGATWLDNILEQIFRYGASEKLCLCGSGFLLGLQNLAMSGNSRMNLEPGAGSYGIKVTRWITPFGEVLLKTHPLFSYDVTTRFQGVILEPKQITYRYIDDTAFYGESKEDKQHPEGYGARRMDGTNEEFLTEAGLEMDLPQKGAVLNGVGLDNSL
jgi:hypothetical protein